MRGGVGLEVNGPVDLLVCKQAAYAHHPALGFADVGQPLPAHVGRMLAPFAVPMLVYYQHAFLVRSGRGLSEQDLQPTLVDLLGSHLDSERNHCRLWASLRCAPLAGSVLARAVKVLLRSAGKSKPSR